MYSIGFDTYFIQESSYEEYLNNKIANEEKLASVLRSYIPVKESAFRESRVLLEAKLSDTIKSKWEKFLSFIKSIFARFMERVNHLLYDEKEYLEKYKKIILNKTPKDGMQFSYNGDYDEAIKRCINTPVPMFNYADHNKELKQEGDAAIVKKIMAGKSGFTYDDSTKLEDLFKDYFLAIDKGEKSGAFSTLNFTNMYNFCSNVKQIESIKNKDLNYLESSTKSILDSIDNELKSTASESFIFANGKYLTETGEGGEEKPNDGGETGKPQQPNAEQKDQHTTGLNITKNSNAISQMGSHDDNRAGVSDEDKNANAQAAKKDDTDGTLKDKVQGMVDKWVKVCRCLITAKCTAVQQIAKDYMAIIREHVRSYTGTKEGSDKDKTNNRATQQSTDYTSDRERKRQQEEAKKNNEPQPDNGGDGNT